MYIFKHENVMNGCGGWRLVKREVTRLVKREVTRLGTTKDRRGMSEQEGRGGW